MPHFVLEYSINSGETDQSIGKLFESLHEAALQTGIFSLKGIRSRAYACDQYRGNSDDHEHCFAHLELKVRADRSQQDLKHLASIIFERLKSHFETAIQDRDMALSFRITKLEPILKFNLNNIPDHLSSTLT